MLAEPELAAAMSAGAGPAALQAPDSPSPPPDLTAADDSAEGSAAGASQPEHGTSQDPLLRYMTPHTGYQTVFARAHHFLMRGDGPLPFDIRHYVAIMAACRHGSHQLVDLLKEEFLSDGGDERWLEGLQHVPKKISSLSEINKLLAHRPWMLNKSHIERLVRGEDNWNLGELLQALTVLAHYHALCSFVQACSALGAPSRPQSATSSPVSGGGKSSSSSSGGGGSGSVSADGAPVQQLMQKMRTLSEQQQQAAADQLTASQRQLIYEAVDVGEEIGDVSPRLAQRGDTERFVEDPDFSYEDFSKRGEPTASATFRVQDYSWEDHGFPLVNRLYSDVGVLLDDKFRIAYTLTYKTMGSFQSVDTTLFRDAVWRYIQCLYGIRHDDYDYAVVNQLLDRRLKSFVKTVCVSPERLVPGAEKHSKVMEGFLQSEKIHVAILCLEARLQSELLYALRAVMRYTT